MSADARLLPHDRYKQWFNRERDRIMDAYLSQQMSPSQYRTAHINLSDFSVSYYRARIQLYGRGYLDKPPV